MTYIIRLLLLVLLISNLETQAQNSEPIDDFRGIAWGTLQQDANPTGVDKPDWNLIETLGSTSTYILNNDEHKIGTAELEEIFYFFHKEAGLFKVLISGKAPQNDEMDAILTNRLGESYETIYNPTSAHMIWEMDDVLVDYKEHFSEDFKLTLKSNMLAQYLQESNTSITDF